MALPDALARAAPWRRRLERRLAPLIARVQPAALSFGRTLTIRRSPPWMVNLWVAGAWITQSISVAVRLGVFEQLKDGPKTAEELARATGAHAPSLYRVLRALASLGIFNEDGQGRFKTTRLGRAFEADAPESLREIMLVMGADWHWQAWGKLFQTVQTGRDGFSQAMGQEAYPYFAEHPEAAALFNAHVEEYARRAARASALYDTAGLGTVVDVGGGYGAVLAAILDANPGLRGVLFDLPDVIERARPHIEAAGLADRCALVGGSFFEAVPTGGDLYVLSSVLHNWGDEQAVAILERCRQATVPLARLLIVEFAIPPGNTPSEGKFVDLQMLALFPGGRERTAAEYGRLLAATGFRLTCVIPTPHAMSLIEAVPM